MNGYSNMNHYFLEDVACKYGLNEAIVLDMLFRETEWARAIDVDPLDGHYWTLHSTDSFTKLFPYLSERQIQRALEKLEKHGLILIRSYGMTPVDSAAWYTVTNEVYGLYGQTSSE